MRLFSQEHARSQIFIQPLHARGKVDVLAQSGVIHPRHAAEIAHVGHAGVQPNAGDQFPAVHVLRRLIAEAQGRFAGAVRMVGLQFRRVPKGKDGIPDILDYRPVGGKDAMLHRALEIIIHRLGQVVRIHAFGDAGETGNVAKENGQQLLFRARLEEFGILGKLLDQLGRKIKGQRLLDFLLFHVQLHGVDGHRERRCQGELCQHKDQPCEPQMVLGKHAIVD